MNKVNYYNYGTHEAFAMSFTVDVSDVAGIRWMEFRRETGNNWLLHQEGTMALNDGLHRFIPAISLNAKGDMALGYCVRMRIILATTAHYRDAVPAIQNGNDRTRFELPKACLPILKPSFWRTIPA
ncbi:MAG: hypothetical protein R2788_03785 [Saprospiraceae bacterium]